MFKKVNTGHMVAIFYFLCPKRFFGLFAHKVVVEIRCVRGKLSSGSFTWGVFVDDFGEFLLLDLIERLVASI